MVSKWIKVQKEVWNFTRSIIFFEKVRLFAGSSDHWAISIEYSHYDRCLSFQFLVFYAGIEVFYSDKWTQPEYISRGDLID